MAIGLGLLYFLYFLQVSAIVAQNTTIKPFFMFVYKLKNTFTMLGTAIYWLTESQVIDEEYLDADQIEYANQMIPWLIYISSAAVFGVQIIGLFIPKLMNNIDQQTEKDFPLKRIKDNMFFILFNFLHVFLIIGGDDTPIQYVFIFLQTFAFYRLASKA